MSAAFAREGGPALEHCFQVADGSIRAARTSAYDLANTSTRTQSQAHGAIRPLTCATSVFHVFRGGINVPESPPAGVGCRWCWLYSRAASELRVPTTHCGLG